MTSSMRKVVLLSALTLLVCFCIYKLIPSEILVLESEKQSETVNDTPLSGTIVDEHASKGRKRSSATKKRSSIHDNRIVSLAKKERLENQSEFIKRVNDQRLLEEKIVEEISELYGVVRVRAHLSTSEYRNSKDKIRPPSATLVLKLRKNQVLSENDIVDIRFLVSARVDGLYPENVVVIDHEGNRLKEVP